MILTASPCHIDADETVSTLNYANMAKLILNKPQKNEVCVDGTGESMPTSPVLHGGTTADQANPMFVRPFAGNVPVKPRAQMCDTSNSQTASAAPKICDLNTIAWMHQYVLQPDGRLTSQVCVCEYVHVCVCLLTDF